MSISRDNARLAGLPSLKINNYLQEIEDAGAAAQFTAINNLIHYSEDIIDLGGDFTGDGEVKCTRVGNQVTITAMDLLTHSSGVAAFSESSAIPDIYRPPASDVGNLYHPGVGVMSYVQVTSFGVLNTAYLDYSGMSVSSSNINKRFTITYNV